MAASLKLMEGKGEFVKRKLPSGEIQDICRCKWNADFAKACIAQVHGAYLEEVIRNNGRYDKGSMPEKRRGYGIDHRCEYCYSYTNWGQVTPRVIDDVAEQEFRDKRPEIVRIGKNVECGHPFYIPTLIPFLELCQKYGAGIIFPTKMLPFIQPGEKTQILSDYSELNIFTDGDLTSKLKKVGGVIHYSICADRFESGAVSQGFTNEWRVEQARRYHEKKVNVDLTIVCDVTQSVADNERAGFYVAHALNSAKKYGLIARILPIRIHSNKLAKSVTGLSMQALRNKHPSFPGFEHQNQGKWRKRGNNEIAPLVLHPDFKELYDSGLGICGEIGEDEYCDDCNLCPSCPSRIVFPLREKPEVDYSRKVMAKDRREWRNREKRKIEKEKEKNQMKLLFSE